MCQIIVVNKGEKEIDTPKKFRLHFGYLPVRHSSYPAMDVNLCLCQCDIDKTFQAKKIEYKTHIGDYYVGGLDNIDFDFHWKPLSN